MVNRYGLAARAADALELPAGALAGVPKVTITGGTRALVENHRGILEYGSQMIEISAGRMVLRILGSELELLSMSKSDILIGGKILSAEFE